MADELMQRIGAEQVLGPMYASSPTAPNVVPEGIYTLDTEAGVLRLDNPEAHPDLARLRPAAPPFLRGAELETATRRSAVTVRKQLAESLESQLKRAKKLEERARRAYEDAKGYEFSAPSHDGLLHTFRVSLYGPRSVDDPFPGPMDHLRSAVVVGCSSDHCPFEGRVAETPQKFLTEIINFFQSLRGQAISARGAAKYLKDQLDDAEQQLHNAEVASKEPVRFKASQVLGVPDSGAVVVPVEAPGRMMRGRR